MQFFYKSPAGADSRCDILVNGNTVVATELNDNPGMSITNAAADLAMMVCRTFAIDPNELVWIEHYPVREKIEETFDIVTFTVNEYGKVSGPQWRRLKENEIKDLQEKFKELR